MTQVTYTKHREAPRHPDVGPRPFGFLCRGCKANLKDPQARIPEVGFRV